MLRSCVLLQFYIILLPLTCYSNLLTCPSSFSDNQQTAIDRLVLEKQELTNNVTDKESTIQIYQVINYALHNFFILQKEYWIWLFEIRFYKVISSPLLHTSHTDFFCAFVQCTNVHIHLYIPNVHISPDLHVQIWCCSYIIFGIGKILHCVLSYYLILNRPLPHA